MLTRLLMAAALIGAPTSAAVAAGDVATGQALAGELCARCHNVQAGGPFKLYPPSFASIAVFRTAEDIRWKIIAPPLHAGMPRLTDTLYLSAEKLDDLVAYIVSLEEK